MVATGKYLGLDAVRVCAGEAGSVFDIAQHQHYIERTVRMRVRVRDYG
jgi:hypothetical protein